MVYLLREVRRVGRSYFLGFGGQKAEMDEIGIMQLGWNQRYNQDGEGRGECKDGSLAVRRESGLGF